MASLWGPAVVLAHQRYAQLQFLVNALHVYGKTPVYALVDSVERFSRIFNKRNFPDVLNIEQVIPVKVEDAFDPDSVVAALQTALPDQFHQVPFLCIQDNVLFSYLEACEKIGYQQKARENESKLQPSIPIDAIRRARLKPLARQFWNKNFVDPTRWALISGAEGNWLARGGLEPEEDRTYVVKPISGNSSELVKKVQGARAALEHARLIRERLEQQSYLNSHRQVSADGHTFDLVSDVLVEEELRGDEFTIDGYVCNGVVDFIVQHKESRYEHPFFGDGLIVSPPQAGASRLAKVEGASFRNAGAVDVSLDQFRVLMERGVRALGLDNWVFHAEAMATANGLRFVELNPRPAGGVLWRTAAQHLGMDPHEQMARLHLGIPTIVPKKGWVTGEVTIYAEQIGVIEKVLGTEEARSIPGVMKVIAIPRNGDEITHLNEENYIAFILLYASSHDAIREAEWQVRRTIQVQYKKD